MKHSYTKSFIRIHYIVSWCLFPQTIINSLIRQLLQKSIQANDCKEVWVLSVMLKGTKRQQSGQIDQNIHN